MIVVDLFCLDNNYFTAGNFYYESEIASSNYVSSSGEVSYFDRKFDNSYISYETQKYCTGFTPPSSKSILEIVKCHVFRIAVKPPNILPVTLN